MLCCTLGCGLDTPCTWFPSPDRAGDVYLGQMSGFSSKLTVCSCLLSERLAAGFLYHCSTSPLLRLVTLPASAERPLLCAAWGGRVGLPAAAVGKCLGKAFTLGSLDPCRSAKSCTPVFSLAVLHVELWDRAFPPTTECTEQPGDIIGVIRVSRSLSSP